MIGPHLDQSRRDVEQVGRHLAFGHKTDSSPRSHDHSTRNNTLPGYSEPAPFSILQSPNIFFETLKISEKYLITDFKCLLNPLPHVNNLLLIFQLQQKRYSKCTLDNSREMAHLNQHLSGLKLQLKRGFIKVEKQPVPDQLAQSQPESSYFQL